MRQIGNLNWIRSFEASARHLSFTEAARELNMTQAGVSQHVRLLELGLHQALFHRLPRGLQLTDAGEAYLHVVRESFDLLTFGTREIFGEGVQGLVTVRTNVAFATHWLAERLPAFFSAHPDISLRLLAAVHGLDTVWDGVDFEIRYEGSHASGLTVVPLMPDRLFPVCHPDIARELVRPSDLLSQRLLHVMGNKHGWLEWFQAAGAAGDDVAQFLQTDTSAISLELAAVGIGVALGHSSLVSSMLHKNILAKPFEIAIETGGVFYLVMPRDRKLRAPAQAFLSWLQSKAADDAGA
jgi:LysR family transcriptional regulator, glycine cleavage system transcriptional activator